MPHGAVGAIIGSIVRSVRVNDMPSNNNRNLERWRREYITTQEAIDRIEAVLQYRSVLDTFMKQGKILDGGPKREEKYIFGGGEE